MLFLVLLATASAIYGQAQSSNDVVDKRITTLERRVNKSEGGATLFLFGAFCALWAQNTGRSSWLWFLLGLLFSVITVVVLLVKNSDDKKRMEGSPPVG